MNDILIFDHVYMSFYDLTKETKVLKDLSFKIKEGNINILIGPSGCGKSTILNLVANIIKPTYGTITKPNNIGYMFQKDNLLEWLTILDNVLIGLKIQKKLNDENIKYAKDLLIKYGLKDFMESYPNELSGGMRQRVALIRAIVLHPKMLLLDEPFSALDWQTRIEVSNDIYNILKDLKITTIMVTHDISEAISLADNILILSDRPATLKEEIKILFNHLTPYERRNNDLFKDYFNKIWGDINDRTTSRIY
jgi:NitT/TauT family transport system ATP-binding protein